MSSVSALHSFSFFILERTSLSKFADIEPATEFVGQPIPLNEQPMFTYLGTLDSTEGTREAATATVKIVTSMLGLVVDGDFTGNS
jgi:hypothetical protein